VAARTAIGGSATPPRVGSPISDAWELAILRGVAYSIDAQMMATLPVGTILGGFRIEGLLGEGGMGVVYRATQLGLERPVALKLIAAPVAADPTFRARFQREAQIAAAIDHPNVIPVYESGEADGRLFIAMRLVEGADLCSLVEREGGLDPGRAVQIVERVAAALDAAHRRGVVHRDVKPANVLVGDGDVEQVYLSDFGLTTSFRADQRLTRTGAFVGTLDYVSPEQITGGPADARSDVYALGCVLFYAIAGRAPFADASDYAKMTAHLEQPAPSLTEVAPHAPRRLDAVIRTAMAKDPGDRHASAGELARAAAATLRGDDRSMHDASRPAASGPAAAARGPGRPHPEATASGVAWRPRPRAAVVLAVLVAGIAAAAAVALAGGGERDGRAKTGGGRDPVARAAAQKRAAAPARRASAGVASIRVGRAPEGVAVDGDAVWVVDSRENRLTRIDPATNAVAGTPVRIGDDPDGVVADRGVVWLTNAGDGTVQRVRAAERPVSEGVVAVGAAPEGISLGRQLVWAASSREDTVSRIDRASAAAVGGPIGVGDRPIGLFVGARSTWVTNNADDTVTRIDTAAAEVRGAPIPTGRAPRGVVEAAGSVWVANSGDDTITRIDARTGAVVGAIRVGHNPREVAAGAGSVWVTNHDDNTVTRIDATTGRVVGAAIPVGAGPLGVAADARAVWVANHGDGTVSRIRP
jgi:YVTN family beta-propeller protein